MRYLNEDGDKIYWNGRRHTSEEFRALGFNAQLNALAHNSAVAERSRCIEAACLLCICDHPLAFYRDRQPDVLGLPNQRAARRGYIHTTPQGLMTCQAAGIWSMWAWQLDSEPA